jgi:hypothetical protein
VVQLLSSWHLPFSSQNGWFSVFGSKFWVSGFQISAALFNPSTWPKIFEHTVSNLHSLNLNIPYPHLSNSLVKGRGWWDQTGKRTGLLQRCGPDGKKTIKDNNKNEDRPQVYSQPYLQLLTKPTTTNNETNMP